MIKHGWMGPDMPACDRRERCPAALVAVGALWNTGEVKAQDVATPAVSWRLALPVSVSGRTGPPPP